MSDSWNGPSLPSPPSTSRHLAGCSSGVCSTTSVRTLLRYAHLEGHCVATAFVIGFENQQHTLIDQSLYVCHHREIIGVVRILDKKARPVAKPRCHRQQRIPESCRLLRSIDHANVDRFSRPPEDLDFTFVHFDREPTNLHQLLKNFAKTLPRLKQIRNPFVVITGPYEGIHNMKFPLRCENLAYGSKPGPNLDNHGIGRNALRNALDEVNVSG